MVKYHPLSWHYRLGQYQDIQHNDDDELTRQTTTVVRPGDEAISPELSSTFTQEKQTAAGNTRRELDEEPLEPSPLSDMPTEI